MRSGWGEEVVAGTIDEAGLGWLALFRMSEGRKTWWRSGNGVWWLRFVEIGWLAGGLGKWRGEMLHGWGGAAGTRENPPKNRIGCVVVMRFGCSRMSLFVNPVRPRSCIDE